MERKVSLLSLDHIDPSYKGSSQVFTPINEFPAEFSGSKIIFAADDHGKDVVLKYSVYPNGAKREWQGLQKVAHYEFIQQPVLLGLDQETDQTVLVTKKMSGQILSQNDESQHRFTLGTMLAQIHNETNIPGEEWDRSQKADFGYFQKSLENWKWPEKQKLFSQTFALPLLQYLWRSIESLPKRMPSFTHQDLHEGQVLLQSENLGIIDFEFWLEADPLEDLAIYLFHLIREKQPLSRLSPLLEGYFLDKDFSEDDKLLISFYTLFIAARAVSFFSQNRPSYLPTALSSLNRVTEYVDTQQLWKPNTNKQSRISER